MNPKRMLCKVMNLKMDTQEKNRLVRLPVDIESDLVIHTLQKESDYHLESSDCPTLFFIGLYAVRVLCTCVQDYWYMIV